MCECTCGVWVSVCGGCEYKWCRHTAHIRYSDAHRNVSTAIPCHIRNALTAREQIIVFDTSYISCHGNREAISCKLGRSDISIDGEGETCVDAVQTIILKQVCVCECGVKCCYLGSG